MVHDGTIIFVCMLICLTIVACNVIKNDYNKLSRQWRDRQHCLTDIAHSIGKINYYMNRLRRGYDERQSRSEIEDLVKRIKDDLSRYEEKQF